MYYGLLIGSILSITAFSVFVALPLYLLVLIVIIRNRNVEPFHSEFFSIFFALGIVDIICYLLFLTKKLFFFGLIPSVFEPFNKANAFIAVYYYPFWAFACMQYQFTLLLTINRFISIVWPVFYNQYWTAKTTRRIIFVCIVFSLVLSIPVPLSECQMTEYTILLDGTNRTFHYGPVMKTPETAKYLNSIWSIHVYGLVMSSIAFYSIMVFVLRKKHMIGNTRSRSNPFLQSSKKRIELQMFYVGFMVFVLNLVFTVYFFLRDYVLVNYTSNSHVHEWILYFISDVYDLPNGFVLLLTSSSIRKIIKRKAYQLIYRKTSVVMITTVSGSKALELQNRFPSTATASAIPLNRQSNFLYVNHYH